MFSRLGMLDVVPFKWRAAAEFMTLQVVFDLEPTMPAPYADECLITCYLSRIATANVRPQRIHNMFLGLPILLP